MPPPKKEPPPNRHGIDFPDDMDKELREMNLLMEDKTVDSLESTRRMLALCEESKEAGIKTLVMLDDQGEQLEKVEGGLDNINQDMKEAEEHLKGMEKCCGLCTLPCAKNSGEFDGGADYNNTWNKDEDGGVVSEQPRITIGDPGQMGGASGGYITKITNDAREDEMDENIQQVGSMVGNLRNMAIDMGTEVNNQNKQLDRINQKVGSMVGNLRNMAIDMGTEVNNQNKQLDRINQKADSNMGRIQQADKRAKVILQD